MTPIKEGEAVIGNRTKIKMVKNKVAAPFRETEVDILYGIGISREGDLLDLAVQQSLVEKSGSWYSFSGERIGQGRENARQTLIERPDLAQTLDAKLREVLELPATGSSRLAPAAANSAKAISAVSA